ncbi:MAG: hypothetical protein ACQ9MH_08840 [Nitrospinales bacterium]
MNKNNLLSIAGGFWGIMGLFLIYRSFALYQLAMSEQAATTQAIAISVICGLIIGGIKGKFVFSKTARKNKTRIEGLDAPHKAYHAFGNKFYILVPGMILLGFLLRHYNEYLGGYVVVGAIYCGIGAALAVSSLAYWTGDSKVPAEENS